MTVLLEIAHLDAYYGWIQVLHGISLTVETGGVTVILGANGAGKTTTLRAISGMVKTSGVMHFAGQRIDGKATEDIVRLGIAHAPEGRGTFMNLTVEENLRLGAYGRASPNGIPEEFANVYGYFPGLPSRKRQLAGTPAGREHQMPAVAPALILPSR